MNLFNLLNKYMLIYIKCIMEYNNEQEWNN